jgi:hypothetical protein
VDDFSREARELFQYYAITLVVYVMTIVAALTKPKKGKHTFLRIISFFVMISALFHFILCALILVIDVADYLDQSTTFFAILAIFQFGLTVVAAIHIAAQKNNSPEPIDYDDDEF